MHVAVRLISVLTDEGPRHFELPRQKNMVIVFTRNSAN
jgi:hypothetical protein